MENPSRDIRIAAVGDLHFDGTTSGVLRSVFIDAAREADILVLCGDLTTHGDPAQAHALLGEMQGVEIPIVAVLGNHDFESNREAELKQVLEERGIHVLDGTTAVIEGIGFAGVKGMGGGFGRGALGAFGERVFKQLVQEALDEALKLETALQRLDTEVTVVLLHYSPIRETLVGEPDEILPYLGSSRLLTPIETYSPDVVFHGHAHSGTLQAATPSGIPVFNVAHPLLLRRTGRPYHVWTIAAPDRRGREAVDDAAASSV
jgi:Icc-related predicted phosphoesterase